MDQNPWFRVYLGKLQPVCWMKLWNLNWGPYTDRGIRQADIYWSAQGGAGEPGRPSGALVLVHETTSSRGRVIGRTTVSTGIGACPMLSIWGNSMPGSSA